MIYWLLQQFSDFDFPGRNLMGYITFARVCRSRWPCWWP